MYFGGIALLVLSDERRDPQVSALILINAIIENFDDFEVRLHSRSQMEAVGMRRILAKCKEYGLPQIDTQVAQYELFADQDQTQLVKNFDQDILRDLSDPYDVYRAIMASVEGTQAYAYFLSAMQHLLLIREDGDVRTRYFQVVDNLITGIVLDKKPGFAEGLTDTIGVSVSRLVAQFGENDRAQRAQDEAAMAHAEASRLRLEKEALEDEIARGGEGMVGQLKVKLTATEDKLRTARQNVESITGRLDEQKRGYEEQLLQLETQIHELFKMLRGAGGLEGVKGRDPDGGQLDREQMISSLQKQIERKRTFATLEGRSPRKSRRELSVSPMDGDKDGELVDDDDAELVDVTRTPQPRRVTKARVRVTEPNGEESLQLLDAEEEREQEDDFDPNIVSHLRIFLAAHLSDTSRS